MAQLSPKLEWALANPKWASQLNPILANQLIQGNLLTGITLAATTPLAINHLLQRMMVGWFIVDQNSSAIIWRTQPFNSINLTLESSANTTLNLWVF